ncbi:MAG: hypothetical protein HY978_03895 [Candidatus Liptonbacteria bacterium]|nr:hypothetical protein [Candidatus Liptonbacteria bacterium]
MKKKYLIAAAVLAVIVIGTAVWLIYSSKLPAEPKAPPPPEPTLFNLNTTTVEYGKGSSALKLNIEQIRQLLSVGGSIAPGNGSWQDYELTGFSSSYTMLPDDAHEKLYLALKKISAATTTNSRALAVYDRASSTVQLVLPPGPGLDNVSDASLSPDGKWLAVGECYPAEPAGCYRLSRNIYLFDLVNGKIAGSALNEAKTEKSPARLVDIVGWKTDGQIEYRVYERISAGSGKNISPTSTVGLATGGLYRVKQTNLLP